MVDYGKTLKWRSNTKLVHDTEMLCKRSIRILQISKNGVPPTESGAETPWTGNASHKSPETAVLRTRAKEDFSKNSRLCSLYDAWIPAGFVHTRYHQHTALFVTANPPRATRDPSATNKLSPFQWRLAAVFPRDVFSSSTGNQMHTV